MYMILMFMERWGPSAGCGDSGLVDWKDSSEGAEETEVGRASIQRPYWGRRNERGQGVGSIPGTVVVFPWS